MADLPQGLGGVLVFTGAGLGVAGAGVAVGGTGVSVGLSVGFDVAVGAGVVGVWVGAGVVGVDVLRRTRVAAGVWVAEGSAVALGDAGGVWVTAEVFEGIGVMVGRAVGKTRGP